MIFLLIHGNSVTINKVNIFPFFIHVLVGLHFFKTGDNKSINFNNYSIIL